MSILTELGVIDIRDRLPWAKWTIGVRGATTSLTWHYNGPAVPPAFQTGEGLIFQLASDARWQMRPGWGGTKNGAPRLMYHLVVAADGQIYQTADLDEILWHCAHQDGNGRGLALHFPLGGDQAPTPIQLAAGFRVTDALCATYHIPRDRVVGHLEWKHATACPGPVLIEHVRAYRAHVAPVVPPTPLPAQMRRWQIRSDLLLPARVRQAPATHWPGGREVGVAGRLKPGTIVYVDVVKQGEPIDGNPRWVHMARVPNEQADLGFLSETLGAWL